MFTVTITTQLNIIGPHSLGHTLVLQGARNNKKNYIYKTENKETRKGLQENLAWRECKVTRH